MFCLNKCVKEDGRGGGQLHNNNKHYENLIKCSMKLYTVEVKMRDLKNFYLIKHLILFICLCCSN